MKRAKKFNAKSLSALIHHLNDCLGAPGVEPTYYSFIWHDGKYAIGYRSGGCFGSSEINQIPSNWSWLVRYDDFEECYAICFCKDFDD